jgi:HAD superfamily hydrolase (TIGR01662 family)
MPIRHAAGKSALALTIAVTLLLSYNSGFAVPPKPAREGTRAVHTAKLKVIFFDIGDTLVTRAPNATAPTDRNVWIPGAKELIAQLQSKGFRVGLISNTGNLKRDDFLKLVPEDFDLAQFDAKLVLLSSEVGVKKPNVEIFQMAVNRAGVSAQETMFVGENLVETLAAQRAGMRSARISPPPASEVSKLADALKEAGVADL